jgi:hypothetical protein
MEDVLAVYTRPRDADHPLVCLDETSKQMLAETRLPIPMEPGRPARCEYERNGTANLVNRRSNLTPYWSGPLGADGLTFNN